MYAGQVCEIGPGDEVLDAAAPLHAGAARLGRTRGRPSRRRRAAAIPGDPPDPANPARLPLRAPLPVRDGRSARGRTRRCSSSVPATRPRAICCRSRDRRRRGRHDGAGLTHALLEVRDLTSTSGACRGSRGASPAGPRRRRRLASPSAQGETLGSGRRERLRQVDAWSNRALPGAADERRDPLPGQTTHSTADAPRAPPPGPDRLPGPVHLAAAADAGRRNPRRAVAHPRHRRRARDTRAGGRACCSEVGLKPDAPRDYPFQFSGGQRQRIGIARALAVSPSLIVADEAVSSLDVSVQAQMLNLLQRPAGAARAGLHCSSPTTSASSSYMSDRIAVMYLGRIVELAAAEELHVRPLHPYTRALMSAVPSVRTRGRRRVRLTGEPPDPAAPPPGCAFHPRCPLAQPSVSGERATVEGVAARAAGGVSLRPG